jgi:glycosyltransferase involved in cell wall biosynthesis
VSAARPRLAVVLSHPTQYYSPWFRRIAALGAIDLHVYYLWDFGVQARHDRDFGQALQWDIPLMDGYVSEFVPNRSPDPGTHHFAGLDNPGLVARLAAARPDAILLFGYAYRSHLAVMLSPRLAGIPMLLRGDSHDLARPRGARAMAGRLARRLLFRRFARVLAVGKANAAYFRNNGVPAARIRFVPHCVDNERFRAAEAGSAARAAAWRRGLGIDAAATVVLFAGKFEDKKRPLDLLAAFLRLLREAPGAAGDAVLLFVGNGALEPELRRLAGEQLGRRVFFSPFQNQSDMPTVYASADLLALPSFGNGETWGLAVNEAMNLARPCLVSSHVGCAQDLVAEGETGWVFEAGDADALHAALARALAAGPEARARMGQRAQARVDAYSFDAAAAALRDALADLPSRAPAGTEDAP